MCGMVKIYKINFSANFCARKLAVCMRYEYSVFNFSLNLNSYNLEVFNHLAQCSDKTLDFT